MWFPTSSTSTRDTSGRVSSPPLFFLFLPFPAPRSSPPSACRRRFWLRDFWDLQTHQKPTFLTSGRRRAESKERLSVLPEVVLQLDDGQAEELTDVAPLLLLHPGRQGGAGAAEATPLLLHETRPHHHPLLYADTRTPFHSKSAACKNTLFRSIRWCFSLGATSKRHSA